MTLSARLSFLQITYCTRALRARPRERGSLLPNAAAALLRQVVFKLHRRPGLCHRNPRAEGLLDRGSHEGRLVQPSAPRPNGDLRTLFCFNLLWQRPVGAGAESKLGKSAETPRDVQEFKRPDLDDWVPASVGDFSSGS